MGNCPSCGAPNPDGYRYCGSCGATLAAARCATCGTANPQGQRFCGQCGAELTSPGTRLHTAAPAGAAGGGEASSSRMAERKLATVLFADVVGFTSLAERTDHELVARMVDAAFRELGEVVTEHGGTVDKYMGDSLMAVFGVPTAHDDDAERAVAAALAMKRIGGDLVFSIGINSGEVMATAVGREEVTVIGDTVNVAARLEKAAAPGEVLCGRLTAELAGGRIEFRQRQPVLLKGKSAPVEVCEAVAVRGAGTEDARDELPLTGRGSELAFLEAQWRQTRDDGEVRLVVICGDAGSGKTRLLKELASGAAPHGTVVRSSYPGYGAMGGSRLAADLLAQLGPAPDPEVDVRVRSVTGEIHESLTAMDPVTLRQEQLWAFGRLFKRKGHEQPLLVIIDDMHRSDERTRELLAELTGRLGRVPLLAVLAGRTEPGDWLTRFPAATTVRLGPLGRIDAAALADAFVGSRLLAPESSQLLVELAGGNPLYLRELVSMARARDMLVADGDRYRLRAHSGIPATLQALLAARLDALEPAQKQVLQHSVVLGEATAEQVTALGQPDASAILESLVAAGFLRRVQGGHYETADSLLREVAYEMLPRNVRGNLHRRAAGIVTRPEERARHLDQAARYLAEDEQVATDASEALAEAGLGFVAASRHVDGMRLLERAVALGLRRPSVLIELGKIQATCGKEEASRQTLALVEDDPSDPTLAVERDHAIANSLMFSDPGTAISGLEDAAHRWRALRNTTKEAWAHANAGVARFNLSQMGEAVEHLEQGLEMFEAAGDRVGAVATSSFLCLAKPTDPRVPEWLEEALDFAEKTGDRSRKVTTLTTLAWQNFIRSLGGSATEMADAATHALQLAELSEELGTNDLALQGWSLLTIMARQTGRLDDAERYAAAVHRVAAGPGHYGSWFGSAASFAATLASGATGAAPPDPPDTSQDPVTAMARLIVEVELALAGRFEEAIERFEASGPPALGGPLADVGGMFYALALVLGGRPDEARPWLDRAAHAARSLRAGPAILATAALSAEISRDTSALALAPASAESITEALVLRAHAAAGDLAAAQSLRKAAKLLAMPGLLAGLAIGD